MVRASVWVMTVGSVVLVVNAARAADDAPAQGPELRRLQPFVGAWRTETNYRPIEWAPQGGKGKGYMTGRWTLNGSFLNTEYHSTGNTGPYSGASMFTYDEKKQAYRLWWFDSRGGGQEFSGQWNEASRSFVLQSKGTDPRDRPVVKRVTYRLIGEKKILVTLEYAYTNGNFKPYIETTYTKIN